MTQRSNDQWLTIVNPNAGTGKCKRDWSKISKILDQHQINYYPVFTNEPQHAIDLVVDFIGKGYRKIITVGGDGTMNEVINGIFKQKHVPTTEITTGMISVGIGNDWVRTFNIPIDYERAIKILKNETTFLQDAGIISFQKNSKKKERYFVNMAGLGFDGLVAQKTNFDKNHGRGNPLLYLKNIFSSLFSYKSVDTLIKIDNHEELKHRVFSIGVGIGRFNGGGMEQVPCAKPDNGVFNMTLIKEMSKWSVLFSLRRLFNGTIGQHKKVVSLAGKKIRIDSNPSILLEADGESLGHSPVELQVVPKSIKVIINHL